MIFVYFNFSIKRHINHASNIGVGLRSTKFCGYFAVLGLGFAHNGTKKYPFSLFLPPPSEPKKVFKILRIHLLCLFLYKLMFLFL